MACRTLRARTTPSTGISFSANRGCEASSSKSAGSCASSTFTVGDTLKRARAASSDGFCPTASSEILSPQPNANSANAFASPGVSTWAPIRWNSAIISSYTSSSMTQVCSAGQMTEESKVFEIRMSTTAPLRSAVW